MWSLVWSAQLSQDTMVWRLAMLVAFCWCYYRYLQLERTFSVSLMCFLWKGWDNVFETCSKLLSLSWPGDKLQLKTGERGFLVVCIPLDIDCSCAKKSFALFWDFITWQTHADSVTFILLCELKFAVHYAAGAHLALFKCGLYSNFILILNKFPTSLRFWDYAT